MAKRKDQLTREDILDQALGDIRSKFGEGAIMRLGEQANLPQTEVIPTGILPLDVALGVGGLPRGRVVEIFGPEGSGKTTIALHALAEAQKQGGVVAFIDAEHALDPRLAAAVGVDIASMYLSQPDSGEQALYILDALVRSGAVDIVVVDSVAALSPQAEIDGKIGDPQQVGLQARLMSYALRRLTSSISRSRTVVIFINQLRAQISSGYGSTSSETTTGGRALKFYSSLRIEVKRGKALNKGDDPIGHELWIKVVKNKLAPPFRTAHTTLIYGKGVPREMAAVDMALDMGVIKRKGSWLAYKGETLGQGKDNLAKYLQEHPELLAEIVQEVLSKKTQGMGLDLPLPNASLDEEEGGSSHSSDELLLEEGILDLDVSQMQMEENKDNP
jgi:recombination protein RecA